MSKVRFSCPRCRTVMQTSEDKIGFDIACPKCSHRFTLVAQESSDAALPAAPESLPANGSNPAVEETAQWIGPETGGAAEPKPYSTPVVDSIPSSRSIPPIYQGAAPGFACPYCRSQQPPITKSEVSTVGWIVCVILLVTTCFFCWVGLLIRDKFAVCSSCKSRLPRLL